MLKKSYSKSGRACRVTFKLTEVEADQAVVLGEFNEWDAESHPLKKRKDGSFSTTMSLEAGRDYRFRYLLDGERWLTDEAADSLARNPFGGQDGVITV